MLHLEADRSEWSAEMGFLNWIKNHNAAREQSVANRTQGPKPENAKAMYAREAAQEKAAEKPITPEIKEKADRALATINKVAQHLGQAATPAAPETSWSPSAQLQRRDGQEKTQAALSPTDGTTGRTPSKERAKTPEKSPERPKTLTRPRPSWER
jgi:hypothetical protein